MITSNLPFIRLYMKINFPCGSRLLSYVRLKWLHFSRRRKSSFSLSFSSFLLFASISFHFTHLLLLVVIIVGCFYSSVLMYRVTRIKRNLSGTATLHKSTQKETSTLQNQLNLHPWGYLSALPFMFMLRRTACFYGNNLFAYFTR
jgi:hypothetical protein